MPQECLILTMKANQKYFPLLEDGGKLTNKFLVVSNIRPADPGGYRRNERVVRPRLADAKFFFDQDRKKPLDSRIPSWPRWSITTSSAPRASAPSASAPWRRPSAASSAGGVGPPGRPRRAAGEGRFADRHGRRVPRAAGHHGPLLRAARRRAAEVADAIEDHYKPRFAGDELPRGNVGACVALADKLETLVGMFGIGQLPTGDKDPFACAAMRWAWSAC